MAGTAAGPELQIVYPGAPGWDEARQAWNLAVDQQPEAVVHVGSVADVVAAVEIARARGWRIAPQGTGHGAAPLGPLTGTLLLRMDRLRGVTVDPAARIVRVEAGALWQDVAEAAAPHGLAALAGSSPDVGVVGYTLGGGLSWLGRLHGLTANSVAAAELVKADGREIRVDDAHEPDLFWALRGGGGSFAVVTALELRLFPLREVYAGILWWPLEQAREVLQAWRKLTARSLPDELTTVGRLLRVPAFDEIPEAIRGKSFAVVEVIHAGRPAEADALLAPLRALRPAMVTLRSTPLTELSRLHMDPDHPVAGVGDGMLLDGLPAEAVDRLVRVAGATSGSSLLSVELRQLGGALARRRPDDGALGALDAAYVVYAVGMAPTPALAATTEEQIGTVIRTLAPWAAPGMLPNFAESSRDPAAMWGPYVYQRLRRVKKAVDPTDLVRANHPVVPARD